jgi:hypothetical protein
MLGEALVAVEVSFAPPQASFVAQLLPLPAYQTAQWYQPAQVVV